MSLITIQRLNTTIDAHLLQNYLESENIESFILEENTHYTFAASLLLSNERIVAFDCAQSTIRSFADDISQPIQTAD